MHARCSLSVNSISLFLSHACSFPLTPSLFCAPSLSLPDSFFSITQTLRETFGVYLRLSHLYIEQFPPALLQEVGSHFMVANIESSSSSTYTVVGKIRRLIVTGAPNAQEHAHQHTDIAVNVTDLTNSTSPPTAADDCSVQQDVGKEAVVGVASPPASKVGNDLQEDSQCAVTAWLAATSLPLKGVVSLKKTNTTKTDKLENVGVANQAKLKGDRCLGLKRVTTGVFLQKSAQLSLMPATQKPASLCFLANTAKEEEAVGKMEDEEEDEQKTEQGEKQEGKEEKEEEEEEGKGEEEDEPLFNSILFR